MAYLPAQARPATGDLFSQLSELARHPPDEIDDMTLARLRKDAERLMKADPSGAHTALGAIAALRWDVDALRKHHECALSLSRDGYAADLLNYSTSLCRVGLVNEAAEKVFQAFEMEREDLSLLRSAISFSLWSGRLGKMRELLDAWRVQTSEPHENEEKLDALMQVFDRVDIAEDELREANGMVFSLVHDHRVPPQRVVLKAIGDREVAQQIAVHADADTALMLNEKVAEAFTSGDVVDPEVAQVLTVYFVGRIA